MSKRRLQILRRLLDLQTPSVVPKTVQWETGTWRKPSSSGLSCLDSPFLFKVPGSVTSSVCLSVPIWEVGSVFVGL